MRASGGRPIDLPLNSRLFAWRGPGECGDVQWAAVFHFSDASRSTGRERARSGVACGGQRDVRPGKGARCLLLNRPCCSALCVRSRWTTARAWSSQDFCGTCRVDAAPAMCTLCMLVRLWVICLIYPKCLSTKWAFPPCGTGSWAVSSKPGCSAEVSRNR